MADTDIDFGDAFETDVTGCWGNSPGLQALVAQTRKMRSHQHEYWRQFRARLTERDIAPAESVLLMLHEDDIDQDYCVVAAHTGPVYSFAADYGDLMGDGMTFTDWTDITGRVPAATFPEIVEARRLASRTALET